MPPRRKAPTMQNPFIAKRNEAETYQQQGERRKGLDAIRCFDNAISSYKEAIKLAETSPTQISTDKIIDLHSSYAETLLRRAELTVEVSASAPDAELTKEQEETNRSWAAEVYRHAVDNFKKVLDLSQNWTADWHAAQNPLANTNPAILAIGSAIVTKEFMDMRVDACVNCGNALSSWAALLVVKEPDHAERLINEALISYTAGLLKEQDADTFNNLADCYIQYGEFLCETKNDGMNGGAQFAKAQQAYFEACSLSSTENGDDLPGLLLSWGAGQVAAAGHASDAATALPLLEEAEKRLKQSIDFCRGDPMPHNCLGEALVAMSEWYLKSGNWSGAYSCATRAISDGYEGALRILSTQTDALVGMAEARAQQAKVCAAGGPEFAAEALFAWSESVKFYEIALQTPEKLGDLSERNDIRYNYACCLVGAGQLDKAVEVVRKLGESGDVTGQQILDDPDFKAIYSYFM